MTPDLETLHHHLHNIIRAATHLHTHTPDLHTLAWEKPANTTDKIRTTKTDHTPRVADDAPQARKLLQHITNRINSIQAEIVGLDRAMTHLFTAHTPRPDPTRGSTISLAEFDQQRTRQRRRPDTPTRLEPQPPHPGRR